MRDNLRLMERHIETLFLLDDSGRLRAVNEPDQPQAPRLFLGRTVDGNIWRFRYDLPAALITELEEILAAEPVIDDLSRPATTYQQLFDVLSADDTIEEVWQGPAWCFPETIQTPDEVSVVVEPDSEALRRWFPYTASARKDLQPCVAVVRDGDAVALCRSARTSAGAAEAGVDTIEAFRRQGLAIAVVAGWAKAVRDQGREPLYSTSWDNLASQAVARRLGLVLYGADLHFT